MARIIKETIQRFNEKYIVDPETECWNWIGCLSKTGYAKFAMNGSWIGGHIFSYEYFNGERIKGLVIAHNCNNRKCVNPKHLRQDTQSSNLIDMVKIKNQYCQILSVDEVIEIKKALKNYYRGQLTDLARFYKVTNKTISSIKRGKRWAWLDIP